MPDIGEQVRGIDLETGELVGGAYLGSYWWNRPMDRCERASVRVNGRERALHADSLEIVLEEG
jgi:hypothetical protein